MNINLDEKRSISSLEKRSKEILELKQKKGMRRPIVIEFCGSPKAGKTTCINALNIFLKRNSFKTTVLTERASLCPVPQKTHPYFNIWTLFSAVANLIRSLSLYNNDLDVILADRAIFDSFCWFEWLNINPSNETSYLSNKDYKLLQNFLNIKFILRNIDLVYVFEAKPEVSLSREYANLLTNKTGTIMNKWVLQSYRKAVKNANKKFKKYFRSIETIDTSELDQNDVNFHVTDRILQILKDMLEENIGFFDKEFRNQLKEGVNEISVIKNREIKFDLRSKIELSDSVQPIPIAVITNKNRSKVLVLKKNIKATENSSPERNKLLLYSGGHIRKEDVNGESDILNIIKNTLNREIQEELNESISVSNKCDSFLIYTPDSEKSKRHLAICFVVVMDLEYKKIRPTKIEFIQKTGSSKSGQVLMLANVMKSINELDSWSTQILKRVFKREDKKLF